MALNRRPLIGIEIGGTKLQIVLASAPPKIQQRWRFQVEPKQGAVAIRQHIQATLREILDSVQPAAVGVGFGGPVDRQAGRIACSHHVEGWSDFALRNWLRRIVRTEVWIDNDANTAALGEATHGAGKGHDPVFYVTLGSGVGGGLTVGGQIYHGAQPGEAEIGHLRLDRRGAIVESRCSGWAVDRKIRASVSRDPEGILGRLVGKARGCEARHLRPALEKGDPTAQDILRQTAEALAFALSHVTHLFHPEVIVIGGGLALVGEPLRAAVSDALPRFLMKVFLPAPCVELAALGEDSVPVGALVLASQAARLH